MTFNFLGPGLTVNVEAKVKEQIILDSSVILYNKKARGFFPSFWNLCSASKRSRQKRLIRPLP